MEVITMRVIIIGNGDMDNKNLIHNYIDCDDKIIICCDGGIKHVFHEGIMPDCILGDFDSANESFLQFFKIKGVNIITFPTKKDKTDMEIGVDFAIDKGADEIFIFGGIGTRVDHTISNIHIIKKAIEKNIKAWIINENNLITIIKDEISIDGKKDDLISLIPLTTKVEGVTTNNLEYALDNATLNIGSSFGISNVMTDNKANIKIKSGLLIVMKSND